MNIKVFCVSFINLLVALAVPAANASPSKTEFYYEHLFLKHENIYNINYKITFIIKDLCYLI